MAGKKTATTALANYDEELAKYAALGAATAAERAGAAGNIIGTQGGKFKIDGNVIKDETVSFVILDNILENDFFLNKFDPKNLASPDCFAFGRSLDEMVPHPDSPKPQAKACEGCEHNEYGTAENGSGKRCRNMVRMGLIPASALLDDGTIDKDDETKYLKSPPTSGKAFAKYVKEVAELGLPTFAVVTDITISASPDGGHRLDFETNEKIEAEFFGALIERHKKTAEEIDFPYKPFEKTATKPAAGKGKPQRRSKY